MRDRSGSAFYSGLSGSAQTGVDIAIGSSAAGAGIATAVAIGAVGGPVGMAIGAGIGVVSMILTNLFGHGCPECEATTHIVDQVEPALQQNLAAYRASPRTWADQQAALANFDYAWARVKEACSNTQFGDAGIRCVSERSPGGVWDWTAYYRTPIADDPEVKPRETFDVSNLIPTGPGISQWLPLALIAGLVYVAVEG